MGYKDLLYSTENSAQCYVAAGIGGEFGGELLLFSRWALFASWRLHEL